MRVFNQDKTSELYYCDKDKGYLRLDKLFIVHHEAIPQKVIKSASQIADEYRMQGKTVNFRDDGNLYVVTNVYPNGGIDEELIEDIVEEGKEAYDEYEDIQVYIPYTEEELKDIKRSKRIVLLNAFDKWEKAVLREREQDDYIIMSWYKDLLDLKDSAFDIVPDRIKYYM